MDVEEGHIFNLMSTNGRRADFINAMNVYLKCLDETYRELDTTTWAAFPKSATQFVFYQKALAASPGVLKKHDGYDRVMKTLEDHNVLDTFLACDKDAVVHALGDEYADFYHDVDVNVQNRARQYTVNLSKIGFTNRSRQITEVGKTVLDGISIERDEIEKLLPIDDINLIYLRQLLKLRIFTKGNSKRFLSPIPAAIYALLKYTRLPKDDFANIIQALSPYEPIKDFDKYLEDYFSKKVKEENGDSDEEPVEIPEVFLTSDELDDSTLQDYFKNRKDSDNVDVYLKFYHKLYAFVLNNTQETLDELTNYWTQNKSVLNKAFGLNKNVFKIKGKDDVNTFLEKNDDRPFLQDIETFNEEIYQRFQDSKASDSRKEYSDTTIRLMQVSGVFKYKGKSIELAYPEIFKEIFKHINIDDCIFGQVDPKTMKQENQYFVTNVSTMDILGLIDYTDEILNDLKKTYGTADIAQISSLLAENKHQEFRNFIETEFPKEHTLELLGLFADRKNDTKIRRAVNPIATVPTIFEYIVGISWYYLSGEDFDLLDSFNLALDADFRPVTHATGGEGDIVINYNKSVVMLEVTLMNAQAQKRGEWEPVLRHTVNEKAKCQGRYALTFFIADELDTNTINIWRAVSMVPLTTTDGTNITVDDVRIMPVSVEELRGFLEEGIPAEKLITCAEDSYDKLQDGSKPIDSSWREDYLKAVME